MVSIPKRPYSIEYYDMNGCQIINITPDQRIYNYLPKDHSWQIFCECQDKLSEYHLFTFLFLKLLVLKIINY